jgi:hypothetical protein
VLHPRCSCVFGLASRTPLPPTAAVVRRSSVTSSCLHTREVPCWFCLACCIAYFSSVVLTCFQLGVYCQPTLLSALHHVERTSRRCMFTHLPMIHVNTVTDTISSTTARTSSAGSTTISTNLTGFGPGALNHPRCANQRRLPTVLHLGRCRTHVPSEVQRTTWQEVRNQWHDLRYVRSIDTTESAGY